MARASLGGGIKGLLRTLFEAGDDTAERRTQDEDVMDEPSYRPNRFDGEYTAWFEAKPLGIGLVPSTQLYGAWEVSSVPGNQTRKAYDLDVPHVQIATGDVVIALNFRCKKAQLSRAAFAAYISKCACPIAVTLRKPDVYGAFDSRSMATAMYPTSMDYQGRHLPEKKAIARASSQQWTRTLQHDLSVRGSRTGRNGSASSESSMEEDIIRSDAAYRHSNPQKVLASVLDMSAQGEFTYVIPRKPIHLVLAPSTRLYGSVEIYDPRVHAPTVHIGDVIMAVNGDASVARWATDDLIDHIQRLQPPITLRLRRPLVYRKYLQQYFRGKKSLASESTAHAMFPNSAEYKNSPPLASASRKQTPDKLPATTPGLKHRQSVNSVISPPPKTDSVSGQGRHVSTKDALRDLRAFASRLNASDQFSFIPTNVDQSNNSQNSTLGDHSSLLTKKHVQFLWKHLPTYLSCNDLELVYTSRRHGWNTVSFYALLEDKGPTILVIQDQRDNLFGAFCSASWRKTGDIYGNGRSFVFTLRPEMKAYPWSGLENSFLYSRRDAVFVGGGKKGIALCLQLDERRGFTQPCDTFDSPALTTRGDFECEVCEVWCFSGLKI